MKIYVRHEGEICELWNYANMKDYVNIKSPSEGMLKVPKREVEFVGFRNGKGETSELKMLSE